MLKKNFPVTCHTDFVGPGSTFVAIPGMRDDGARYIDSALQRGARRIIIEATSVFEELKRITHHQGAELVVVENARKALAYESAKALNFPAKQLTIFAVTGTKGKTTTAFLFAHILKAAGYKAALLSSEANILHDEVLPASLTTPQPDYLHVFFKECLRRNITHVVMEVAAQAVSCHRIEGITFDGLIFTNFAQEHGEFYATQEEYFAAKCQLIEYLKPEAPLFLNADDAKVSALQDKWSNVFMYGSGGSFQCINSSISLQGASLEAQLLGETATMACPTLLGDFNTYNMVSAAGFSTVLGIESEKIKQAFASFEGVPGRLNPQEKFTLLSGAQVFIDKAHNPSSFEAVLSTLAALTEHLIVVFGAGGERDKEKRPLMGAVASKYADSIVLTSDNPRSEDPEVIISDICKGISLQGQTKVIKEIDRESAILRACSLAKQGSIVALLGKGMEQFQHIGKEKIYFSEQEIVASMACIVPHIAKSQTIQLD